MPAAGKSLKALGAALALALVTTLAAPQLSGAVSSASAATEPTLTSLSVLAGKTAKARTVTITGSKLDRVRTLYFGGSEVTQLKHVGTKKLTVRVGTAPDFQPGQVHVKYAVSGSKTKLDSGLVFTFKSVSAVDRQLDYVFDNWNVSTDGRYFYVGINDCANFVSQSLEARGLTPNARWHSSATYADYTESWIRVGPLAKYLRAHGAKKIADSKRSDVAIGDVVVFDWNPSDRDGSDHTGIVSKIKETKSGKVKIYYAAHTKNVRYRSVDHALHVLDKEDDATAYYLRP